MKIVTNEKLVQRNSRIGMVAIFASMSIIGVSIYLSFTAIDPAMLNWLWIAPIVAFLLMQVGVYFGNRWGRHPRPDEVLDEALKGLDDRYTVYHYSLPVHHLLVGPVGLWVLEVYPQAGKVTYNEKKKRWEHQGGTLAQRYMRIFAQESLGRPDLDVEFDLEKIQKHLKTKLPDVELPEMKAALVFTHPTAAVGEIGEAPIPALLPKGLKEYVRKTSKGKLLPTDSIKQITDVLAS